MAFASTCRPQGHYDLISNFYIQLFPEQRAAMLSNMSKALVPGGTLPFVSHDKSGPPSGWSEEDLLSLTTPEEIAAELSELKIEQATVLNHEGPDAAHMEERNHQPPEAQDSSSTVVRATRPVP